MWLVLVIFMNNQWNDGIYEIEIHHGIYYYE